jgi:hypothetical protein
MRMTRTWDSTMSMIPKGGDTIWGGLDWSPEDGCECKAKKQKGNDTEVSDDINGESVEIPPEPINYGRLVSFGKDVAEARSSEIERIEFRVSIQQRADTTLLIFKGLMFSCATCRFLLHFALFILFQIFFFCSTQFPYSSIYYINLVISYHLCWFEPLRVHHERFGPR